MRCRYTETCRDSNQDVQAQDMDMPRVCPGCAQCVKPQGPVSPNQGFPLLNQDIPRDVSSSLGLASCFAPLLSSHDANLQWLQANPLSKLTDPLPGRSPPHRPLSLDYTKLEVLYSSGSLSFYCRSLSSVSGLSHPRLASHLDAIY